MADDNLNAVVHRVITVAPGLIILQVKPDDWETPDFEPGQYGVLGLPGSARRHELSDVEETAPDPDKLIKRAYSIASSSKEKQYVELYITLIRSGALTPRIFALKAGERIFLGQKFKGVFRLDHAPEEANLVMVATGTGVAPYMSMIRSEFTTHPDRRFALLHGARHSWDLGYRGELETLDHYFDNFTYAPTISRPDEERDGWSGHVGYVQELWKKGVAQEACGCDLTPENTHIFLCGAPNMVEELVTLLASQGFKEHKKKAPGQVHVERFW